MLGDHEFIVQFLVVKEIRLKGDNEIPVEVEAFNSMSEEDRRNTLASYVFGSNEGHSGAIGNGPQEGWDFALDYFDVIDDVWLEE